MAPGLDWSKTWSFYEGDWHEGNIPIMGVRSHAAWLCSSVFDGARTFEGVSPDLDLHCARVNASAATMHLKPTVSADTWLGLTQDGIKRFAKDAALYIRPMYWAERSGARPAARRCARPSTSGGCLYPNNARALIEANAHGFGNCAVRDLVGNIAELATANLFIGKDGVVFTPAPNGTFLNGITRQRVIKLLREAGVSVVETTLQYSDLQNADEIFSSGNYSKVMPVNRIDERSLQPGPLYRKARELYWAFAHSAAG